MLCFAQSAKKNANSVCTTVPVRSLWTIKGNDVHRYGPDTVRTQALTDQTRLIPADSLGRKVFGFGLVSHAGANEKLENYGH